MTITPVSATITTSSTTAAVFQHGGGGGMSTWWSNRRKKNKNRKNKKNKEDEEEEKEGNEEVENGSISTLNGRINYTLRPMQWTCTCNMFNRKSLFKQFLLQLQNSCNGWQRLIKTSQKNFRKSSTFSRHSWLRKAAAATTGETETQSLLLFTILSLRMAFVTTTIKLARVSACRHDSSCS